MRGAARGRLGSMAVLFALALAVGAARPVAGSAQTGSVPSVLAGTWVCEHSAERAMSIVDAAFAPGVEALPFFFQSMARERIHGSMQPATRVTVTLAGAQVRVVFQSNVTKVIDGALGAQATTSGLEAETRVTTGLHAGWLQLSYDGEGDMIQLLSTEPDGSRMHVDSTVTSERLPAPVRWRLDYVRAGS